MTRDLKPNIRIYLCGMMGSGKSTVGRLLARRLNLPHFDLDEEIEKNAGKTIPEIFQHRGESEFRRLERELLDQLHRTHGVHSLGGGALQNQQIVDLLKSSGFLIYLEAPLSQLSQRLGESKNRPLLNDKNRKQKKQTLEQLYIERTPYYHQANLLISTESDSPEAVVQKILLHPDFKKFLADET